MKKLLPVLLALTLTGCFGPATLDTSNKESIKLSTEKLRESLPSDKKELLSKAIAYFSMGGSKGVEDLFRNAFNGKTATEPTEASFINNLQPLNGKTSEEILALYEQQLANDKVKREKREAKAAADKEERAKVRELTKEAEKLLSSNKFQEALNKYKDMSLLKSGIEASEQGISKTNSEMKSFTEKTNYIEKIKITEFTSTRIDTYLKKDLVAVRMGFKNTGDRSLDEIKVLVFFQDSEGNDIHEEEYYPVLVSKYSRGKPLKPGYSYEMEKGTYKTTKSPLSEWKKGQATIKIVDIKFSE